MGLDEVPDRASAGRCCRGAVILMEDKNKVYHAGKARQEELDEIDQCRLCEIMPELENTCYATKYCHRQSKMDLCQ